MLKALYYCHNVAKVIHRDIKPANIVINHNYEAVLIDFGVSCMFQDCDILESSKGTYLYFAPEMFDKSVECRGERTDLWALGITLFYMMCGKTPYDHAKNCHHLRDLVLNEEINVNQIQFEPASNLL